MLTAITVDNFRCIEHASLDFDSRSTGIIGDNASGKTSLLEAIYFLGHGRSFRSAQADKLKRTGTPFFRVVGRLATHRGILTAGLEHTQGRTQGHLAGQGISGIADIAEVLPLQIIDPGVHRLVEEGSARRRRLMDWGVFHVKREFLGYWRRYQRALSQRNAALRTGDDEELIRPWEHDFCSAGGEVDRLRAEYVQQLSQHFEALAARLVGPGTSLVYRRGWPQDLDLREALHASISRDLRLKTTHVGPHRADVGFVVEGVAARDRVSRGQQKMLAAAFILAQLQCHSALGAPPTTLMLDDPAAELDVDNLGKLLLAIAEIPSQLIVTSVHEHGLKGIDIGRRFHVEQGRFASMA
ncbi:MAG TPA: DNA replication/repair protein RecF [Nitrospiraceae bacterium]|nr:DNA replication/repair protein RecF [Nitrospiraceae bacterium]